MSQKPITPAMQISTIASTTRRTLATVTGIIDEYAGQPLKLHAGLLNSMNRTLVKCLGFVDSITKLEDMLDDPYADIITDAADPYREAIADLKAEVWPSRPKSATYPPDDLPMDEDAKAEPVLTSFLLLEAILATWDRMKSIVDEINKFLEAHPGKATANLLDASVTFAANSIKFQQMAEYVSSEKARALEIEQNDGYTTEEREIMKQWDEIRPELEELTALYSNPADPYTTAPGANRHSLTNKYDLETEEDYRYGMNPSKKSFSE